MQSLIKKVSQTIKEHRLLRKQGKVIVAVSGGADSVALLSVLTNLGYDCVAAHCNFHLRGDESNRDMHHVEAITERIGVDLYVKEFNVAERMKETGESIEMACRELRYKWFFDLLDKDSAQAIAVGHHKEDQVETFFLNLLRSSGLTGLAGMRYRNEHVVRPFLDVSRKDIENYLIQVGLDWIVDSSNSSDEFKRNRIRNNIIPMFESLFPGSLDAIYRSMSFLREYETAYSFMVKERSSKYVNDVTGEIRLREMIAGEPFANMMLYEMLKGEGFNKSQTDDMLRAATKSGGSFRAHSTHIRDVDHGILRGAHAGRAIPADAVEVSLIRDIFSPVRIEVSRHVVTEFNPERNPATAYLDASCLDNSHTWHIRKWRKGDRMTPFGMKGSKLVSDVFADAKLSAMDKSDTWLLTCDDKIVWVIGVRNSALFTVGPSTRAYIQLRFIK